MMGSKSVPERSPVESNKIDIAKVSILTKYSTRWDPLACKVNGNSQLMMFEMPSLLGWDGMGWDGEQQFPVEDTWDAESADSGMGSDGIHLLVY